MTAGSVLLPSIAPPTASEPSSDDVLRQLHVAGLRARIIANEFDTITVALSAGWIDGATALEMLDEGGLLPLIDEASS